METLDPLGVEGVGLGAGAAVRELAGLDEEDGEAARFKELEEGDPGDPGGLQGDGGDGGELEPVGDGPDGAVGEPPGGDADPVHIRVDVDPGGVGVDDLQGGGVGARLVLSGGSCGRPWVRQPDG